MGVDRQETWRLLDKAGWDSVPAVRKTILRCLHSAQLSLSHAQIEEGTGLPQTTISRTVEDLQLLDLVHRSKDERGHWYVDLAEDVAEHWTSPVPEMFGGGLP
jgi:hypothetical protein